MTNEELSQAKRNLELLNREFGLEAELYIPEEPDCCRHKHRDSTEYEALLKRLNRERNMSILFISHNLNVVRKLCTRVAVMERGLIVEEGETQQVFHHPEAPYTQRLIAAIPTRRKIDG